jgi:type I restriction enzyme S subunit
METALNGMKRGAGVPHISGEALSQVVVPLPTIQEQNRIVGLLDQFDKLSNDMAAGIPAEIKARKKQYEYYRDKLLTFNPLEG